MTLKVGFIVSGKGETIILKHFIKNAAELGILIHVFSYEKDCTGISMARENHILYTLVDKGNSNDDLSKNLITEIKKFQPELVFLLFNRLLSESFLKNSDFYIVNIHPSILPAYTGFRAIDKAIEYGSKVTGVTAHLVDVSVDGGPVIIQSIIPLSENVKNYFDLQEILRLHYKLIATQVLLWIKEKRLKTEGRIVKVHDSKYELSSFYPNIEAVALTICSGK